MQNTSVQGTSSVKEKSGEDYPEMVGFIKEKTVRAETQNQTDEPEEIITKGSFLQRGGMKAIVVGCGVFLFVGLFGATIYGLKDSVTNRPQVATTTTTKTERHDPEESTGQQKTEVALTSQKAELSNVGHDSSATSPTPTATPTATPTLNPKPKEKVRPLSRETSPPPPRQTQIVHAPVPVSAPERMHSSTTFSPPRQPPQIMAVKIQPHVNSIPTPTPSIDPNAAWQAAANIGMYGDGIDSSEVKPDLRPKDLEKKETKENSPTVDYNSGRSVIVGSHASGRLETAIAWTGSGNAQNQQSYLIRLTEPLKSADGTVIIPKEAMIVAHVKSATEAGLLDMSAVSIVVQEKNGVVEKSIPEGAILIQGGGGSPLKAQYRVPSHFGADVRTAALAGMGKAAEIFNSSDSTISINNGGSSATSSNGRRNIWAGAIQGSTQELVNRAQQTNNQRNNQENNNYNNRIFTLDKGADVQLFVNRSVNL